MNRRQFFSRLGAVVGAAICLKPAICPREATPAIQAIRDPESGLSIRFIRHYDITADSWPQRLDVLYGTSVIRPELVAKAWRG